MWWHALATGMAGEFAEPRASRGVCNMRSTRMWAGVRGRLQRGV